MIVCRLLPTATASGRANMARDEALLQSALDCGAASLRFYYWSEPTLSLGYFQSHTERLADPLLKDVVYVRRPTGGAAILHHYETTYALALPAGLPWHNSENWICRMHHAIAAALRRMDVHASAVACGEEQKLGPHLCFLHQTPADLRVNGHKAVGSARRRPRGATMQHGSILLKRSPYAPALPGICDLAGREIDPQELEQSIVGELAKATGWSFEHSDWTDAERRGAAELERGKYATRQWNEKR